MRQLTLRNSTQGDTALIYAITEEAMREYMEETSGAWNSEEQLHQHQRRFDPISHKIIIVDGVEAGCIAIEDFPTYTWLVKIYLLRGFRGLGIGSELISGLLRQAAAEHKALRLQVLRVNKRAQKLYFRHGFQVAHETHDHLFLERAI